MKHLAPCSVHHTIKLKFVIVDRSESGGLLIFSDTAFEEVLFLLDIHHLGEPWERVFDTWIERFEAHAFEAAICDVVNILAELVGAETDRVDG